MQEKKTPKYISIKYIVSAPNALTIHHKQKCGIPIIETNIE